MKYKRAILAFLIFVYLLAGTFAFAASQDVSSRTAQSIIDDARVYLNETDSSAFWDDTEMLRWLNDGMVDIVSFSHCLETTENISLLADTMEYTITTTYIKVRAVHYVDSDSASKGLIQSSPADVGKIAEGWNDSTETDPVYWYEWAGKIGVFPTKSSVTTEVLKLYLTTLPSAITISDNVTTPYVYDKALSLYIVAQAMFKDRQTGRYAQVMGMYMQELLRYRTDLNESPRVTEDK